MNSVCFFNNKGGVGKTTLACNIAAFLAMKDLRILVLDVDPQCNATQLILEEDYCTAIYSGKSNQNTVLDVLQPIFDGDSKINPDITPVLSYENRFRVDLIPGHPSMSLVEDKLSEAWQQVKSGDVGGARKTNWLSQLLKHIGDDYDLVICDVGPSLGALNRTVLIGTGYFVTPMGCDIFSILGIRNISDWLDRWHLVYENGLKLCEQENAGALKRFDVTPDLSESCRYAGYTVQQYITKSKGGVRRPTSAFEAILNEIPGAVQDNLSAYVPNGASMKDLKLGDIPNMYSLVPLAQSANAPIHGLNSKDDLVGSQWQQLQKYREMINAVSSQMLLNMGCEL